MMAASDSEIVALAEAVTVVAEAIRAAKYLTDQVLANNSAHGVDWSQQPAADALAAAGKPYTAAEIEAALAPMQALQTFWNQGNPTNGSKIELLSRPIV